MNYSSYYGISGVKYLQFFLENVVSAVQCQSCFRLSQGFSVIFCHLLQNNLANNYETFYSSERQVDYAHFCECVGGIQD